MEETSNNKILHTLAVGIDIGSTTVKAVVCDPCTLKILWSDYKRHEAQQANIVHAFMITIGLLFPQAKKLKIFTTGSGSSALTPLLNGLFVQEVNAVTLAVEKLHPDVGSVVELGGQDAKIIIFQEQQLDDGTIEKNAIVSMNDKCASGTGATIDKCMLKVGMPSEAVQKLIFNPNKLHVIAAKCGVFAETDVVNLIKSGIPAEEIMNSLADAIVHQNLSVLTRGNTLKPKVLLLGGPNTYLSFLVECWRLRIPETWHSRGTDIPKGVPIEELIFAPENAQYFAAYGAVLYGLTDSIALSTPCYFNSIDPLNKYINSGVSENMSAASSPLVSSEHELNDFLYRYRTPEFIPAKFKKGDVVQGVIGLDGGSTSSKAVLVDYETGEVLFKAYTLSKGNPIQDSKDLLASIYQFIDKQGAIFKCEGFGATGYAADVLQQSLNSDVNIVETVAHMMSAVRYFPNADVVCDIGGQDIKVLFLTENNYGGRDVKDFKLSNQCSAGNGMLLQAMADQFSIPLEDYASTAFKAEIAPRFSYGCGVFLDADRVNFQKDGFSAPQMLAGLAQVLPKNIWQYVVQVPRLAEFGKVYVLQGGTQKNMAAVKAQVDYIESRVPDAKVYVHPHTGEAGAIGAAMETLRVVKEKESTQFIGIEQAIDIQYTTKNDASTQCHFCVNNCSRTFIDTVTPNGGTSRYIAGFSCDKGTVEDFDALKIINKARAKRRKVYPNLVEYQAKYSFKSFIDSPAMPDSNSSIQTIKVTKSFFNRVKRKTVTRNFIRSNFKGETIKIGLPRTLNLYALAPFFQAYFEGLGIPSKNIIWSEPTNEKMWVEGGRYGSIDPCFPSKSVQSHIHELLFHAHKDSKKQRGPIDYLFFPCITHVPTWLEGVMDSASCPIAAGSPNVVKAAFTKEKDFFADASIEFLDPSLTFAEPNLLADQLFKTFGKAVGISQDENDFAVTHGLQALNEFDQELQSRGKELLEKVTKENNIAILLLSRPYHLDPGLNHGILDEFQALGYPILSIQSIPKDPTWLAQYMGDNPLNINDVWPENFSANSAQKVWAAKFAACHPNVAVMDLSSFKCGHDAPTYAIISSIMKTSKSAYSAIHDIDANKPSGSIKIRVMTYAHKLQHVKQQLIQRKESKEKLNNIIALKRIELETKYNLQKIDVVQL